MIQDSEFVFRFYVYVKVMFLDLGMEEIDVMGLLKVILGLDVDEDVKKVVK